MRYVIRILSTACLLISLMAPVAAADDIAIGNPAPALIATQLDGKTFDLAALKGKVTLIHFWATWCAPCREEMPALEAVWRQYHGQGLQILAISADRPRATGDVRQVMHIFTFPAALLGDVSKNDFGAPHAIPITYVIDRAGKIDAILTPDAAPLTEAGLGDEIKKLLAAKAEAGSETKSDPQSGGKP